MRNFNLKNDKWLLIPFGLLLFLSACLFLRYNNISAATIKKDAKIVVIDAGHGGSDSGAIGGKVYEKNINLNIALNIQKYLEQDGYIVIMTRTTDIALAKDKQADMWRREELANNSGADIFVSIHQNYNSRSSCKGAQTYFFGKSVKSQLLAKNIQHQIINYANPSTKYKNPLPNADYYVLRQTEMPATLVECGFLSNPGERWKLTTRDYQDTIAKAIYFGIINYFDEETNPPKEQTQNTT